MENYSYSSYPDSVNSSPRSREIDVENASWDEQPAPNYKVKLLCSYGGKIQPRPHDNQLTYVAGDTKILAVDRYIKFSSFVIKLSSICDCDITFKYQLPGEDLDALISVTNDEDLDHMMLEYDRLCKSSAKPARLRLFLFPLKPIRNNSSFGSSESKSESQWFVDALNSATLEAATTEQQKPSPPPPASETPDYLFGLEDKPHSHRDVEIATQSLTAPPQQPEIHRQIEELQRLQISGQDQSPRFYGGEYNSNENHHLQSVTPPPPPQQTAFPVNSPAGFYYQDSQVQGGGYSHPQTEKPVYLIQTPTGIYQAPQPVRQMTGQAGQAVQGYYGMQRMVPEVYREQPVYNPGPQQNHQYMRGPPPSGYAQVAIDGSGRQVYYMAAAPVQSGSVAAVGPGYNPDNGPGKVSQPSSM